MAESERSASVRTVHPHSRQRRALLKGAAALASVGLPGRARAQGGGPVKVIVGFPPGGSGDIFARIFTQHLHQELGQPVIVDNRPGAGGLTAVGAFQRAPNDGTTLMMHTGSTAITVPISRKVPPYDPVTDFTWVAWLSNAPFVIAVHSALPIDDLRSLIAYCRERPGKLSYGHAGLGTTVHLAAELLKDRAGIQVTDVPYTGSGPALNDTIAGNVAFIVETYGTLIQQHKGGRIRIVGAFAENRLPELPDVGTAREIGLDVVAGTVNLLAAPNGMPADKLRTLALATARAMARPAMQQQLVALGIEPITTAGPEQAKAYVAQEVARWSPLVKKLGIAL